MIRLIPPVAVSAGSVKIAGSILRGSDHAFREQLVRESGMESFSFFPSGRAALSHLLAIWAHAERDEVVIPAYTCWSVAAAIVRAGLRIRVVDVDPLTLDYRAGALEAACGGRTAAVVAVHLFARTADTDRVARAAQECGARWVDDAAQALPRRPTGSDAAIYSFGRGKPLALGGGGALSIQARGEHQTVRSNRGGGLFAALRFALTSLLAHPACYRFPRSLPFLKIGTTLYNPEFDMDAPFYRWQARLGALLRSESAAADAKRSLHAERLVRAAEAVPGWSVPAARAIVAGPLRLPLLAPSRSVRDRTRSLLWRMGVDSSAMYPDSIDQIPGIKPHLAVTEAPRGAAELVGRLLTLPTYPTLTTVDLNRVEDAFVSAAGAAG